MALRMRARHRLHEPERPVDRAADADIVAVLGACCSARDRLIVLLMARAGLRRAEVLGLRRSDVHLLAGSRVLGCEVARAHLHVVRREDNPNGAVAKSRRQRVVPLDFVTVQAFDTYEFERMRVPQAARSDFVLVNLFRGPSARRCGWTRSMTWSPLQPGGLGWAGLRRRIRCGTLSPRMSLMPAGRSMRLRSCSGTPRSPPRRFTRTRTRLGCGPLLTRSRLLVSLPG